MSKLAREALMHYLDASFKKTADTAEWAILVMISRKCL